MKNLTIISAACLIFAVGCNDTKTSESKKDMDIIPPKAEKIAKNLEMHGDVRIDEYYWLNDKENPEVIDSLWTKIQESIKPQSDIEVTPCNDDFTEE